LLWQWLLRSGLMRQSPSEFLKANPVLGANPWLALGGAWFAAIGAVLWRQQSLSLAMLFSAPALVALLGFYSVRSAFFGEQRKLTALLNAVPEGVLEIDANGLMVFVNPQLCHLFGYEPNELIGQSVEKLVPPSVRAGHAARRGEFWSSAKSRPMGSSMNIFGIRKDGSPIAVDVSLSRLETKQGTVMYCLVRDDSTRRAYETKLLDSNRQLTDSVATLERNSLELRTLTEMGELLHSSNTETELCGIVGNTMRRLFPGWSGALYMLTDSRLTAGLKGTWGDQAPRLNQKFAADDCWALRRGRPHRSGDHPRCNHITGKIVTCSHCIPLLGHGELMGVLHLSADTPATPDDISVPSRQQLLQAIANQVALSSANLRLRDTLRTQSSTDPLTGLNNRRAIDERFGTYIQQALAEKREASLLVLDIDHFKAFNDRFGHDCGDLALRELGALLRRSIRHDDVVCRMGGEEFAVLLPATSLPDAERAAEKLRLAVDELCLKRNGVSLPRISVSIGLAALGPHGSTVAELLRHADRALYRAKAAGRNCVMTSNASDETGQHPRMSIVQRPT
jgi:diguanylate cyclase (GGDEF)-like protein/PAS domain S-box-containing protein